MSASAAAFFGSSRRGTLRTDSPAKVVAGRYGIVDDPVWCRTQDLCNKYIALILLRFSFGKVHCRKASTTQMALEAAV